MNPSSTYQLLNSGYFESQLLATGVAYKNTVYRYNCQANYTLFKHEICKMKKDEIRKK